MAYTFKHGDRPLDGYVIQRGVGRGGFGEVYYAVSDGGKEVALKYLRDNPSVELRGVSHCLNLKSPHLVSLFDVRQNADGDYFIVMEYVAGPSLRDLLIAEAKGVGAQKAAYFVREIGKGLAYLHDRGIVHRDLKPGNIFYEDGYVKIGDYGLSKFISVSRHSAQTASVGTVHYMAPEVGSGSYQRGVDIYALGVILYEMLMGRVPFEGSSMGEVLMKHLTAQPEVDDLPAPFPDVIRKALAKDPNERYQTVDEMVDAIFNVDDIKESVVGFNPVSLASAVRRGAGDIDASPMPSPNPTPMHPVYGPPPPPLRRGEQLSANVARRYERISDKVERRLARLQGRRPRRTASAPASTPLSRGQAFRRFILSAVMSVGIAFGVALLVGNQNEPALAVTAGLLIVAISVGVGVSQRLQRWFGPQEQVGWARRVLVMGCCAPLMLAAAAPALAERSHASFVRAEAPDSPFGVHIGHRGQFRASGHQTAEVWAVFVALLAAAVILDWSTRIESGARGELRVGQAIKAGLLGFVLLLPASGVFGVEPGPFLLMAAGVAAASSLVVQVFAWVRPARAVALGPSAGVVPPPPPTARREVIADESRAMRAAPPPPEAPSSGVISPPLAIPIEPPSESARTASTTPLPALRWGVTRAFWSVAAFGLLTGAVGLFLSLRMLRFDTDDKAAAGAGCAACAAMTLFALSKTSMRRRGGFWRDTLRPLLMAVSAGGIAAPLVALKLARSGLQVEEMLALKIVMTMSGVLLGTLLLTALKRPLMAGIVVGRLRKQRPREPFVLSEGSSGGDCCQPGERAGNGSKDLTAEARV